jgi:hypothetical protein
MEEPERRSFSGLNRNNLVSSYPLTNSYKPTTIADRGRQRTHVGIAQWRTLSNRLTNYGEGRAIWEYARSLMAEMLQTVPSRIPDDWLLHPNCRYGPKSAEGRYCGLWRRGLIPLSTRKSHPSGLPGIPEAIKVEADSVRKGEWTGGHLPHRLGWMNGRTVLRRKLGCYRRDGPRTHHYHSRKGWRWTCRNMDRGCDVWYQWLIRYGGRECNWQLYVHNLYTIKYHCWSRLKNGKCYTFREKKWHEEK